eukprot:5438572-Amphidinium_carterae.2
MAGSLDTYFKPINLNSAQRRIVARFLDWSLRTQDMQPSLPPRAHREARGAGATASCGCCALSCGNCFADTAGAPGPLLSNSIEHSVKQHHASQLRKSDIKHIAMQSANSNRIGCGTVQAVTCSKNAADE